MVRPADLDALKRDGTAHPSLAAPLSAADVEELDLLTALEGPRSLENGVRNPNHRPLSAQKRAILDDVVRMGLVLRGELRRYVQALDGDAGARVGTLASARARLLGQLGLDHLEHDVDLRAYLAQNAAQNGAGATNGAAPDAAGRRRGDGRTQRHGGRACVTY
jgi:hypothetical protein